MSEGLKNVGKSIRTKLLNVAKEEGVFYQTILTRYFQERLLYRMSQTAYRENFFLKGGALMYAYEHFAARPTLDIDFLGENISNQGERIATAFREICSVPCEEDGVTFDVEKISFKEITEFKDYHGIRLNIPVSMDTIRQVMSMDIGFGDVVTPRPVPLDYPLLLTALPRVGILAYSIETVIAEKMHAVVDLADKTSRMKDYYDLYIILNTIQYDIDTLREAVKQTFANRHTQYFENTLFFSSDFKDNRNLDIRWQAFVRKIGNKSVPAFAQVVEYLQNKLRPHWEAIK